MYSLRFLMVLLFMLVLTIGQGAASNPNANIWISPDELEQLPMQGESWEQLKSQAKKSAGSPKLSNQDQDNNVHVLAKALVYARCSLTPSHSQCSDLNLNTLRDEVIDQVMAIRETENGGRTLALGRELAAYVIAADLVGLPAGQDATFRQWLSNVRHETLDGKTLISTHEDRPNNWGTMAGASRIAAALYLDDTADLDRAARVFQGWLGDRTAYAGFSYGDLSWQCNPQQPVGINPKGCTKSGHSIDGVLPDDQRRGGSFRWPPPRENYTYEALQGVIVQAALLHRAGYDVFQWSDQALLRAYQWLANVVDFPATGDDTWQTPVVDCFYGSNFWNGKKTQYGKIMGWTDWTHAYKSCRTHTGNNSGDSGSGDSGSGDNGSGGSGSGDSGSGDSGSGDPAPQGPLSIVAITASTFQAPNVPANTHDQHLDTRWSADGEGQWIAYDLGTSQTVGSIAVAWFKGADRTARFDLEVSTDGTTWTRVHSGSSSGTTLALESYDIADVAARFVRIVGLGNSSNSWNSITEVVIAGANGSGDSGSGDNGSGSGDSGSGDNGSGSGDNGSGSGDNGSGDNGSGSGDNGSGGSGANMPLNFTVAFIGDSGSGSNFRKVLQLIQQQGADMVIHSGDLGYDGSKTSTWEGVVNDVLGANFPYFAAVGNHDSGWSGGYGKILAERAQRVGAQCSGAYGENAACTYQGLFFILSGGGEKGSDAGNAAYIKDQLAQNTAPWRICAWHHNQKEMQVGGKNDEVGWQLYEACREGGAIVATAHEHSYSRTHLLSHFETQTVASTSNTLQLRKGESFVVVSGLGGKSIRDQERCFPTTAPYGCKGEWASIYTSNQGANYGALFCTFNAGGVANKASCYFMAIDGEVPDQFTIISNVNN